MAKNPNQLSMGAGLRAQIYLLRHAQTFFYSLGQLWRTPFSTLMTTLVIGIALALPTGLHVVLDNARELSGGWQGSAQLSLFLKQGISDERANRLKDKIQSMTSIASARYLSPETALAEFKNLSGFGEALEALNDNPLPGVVVVIPTLQQDNGDSLQQLAQQFNNYPEVELAQLDMQWIRRLFAIMEIVQRGVSILAILLAMAVVLTTGNTIRLAIQSRRQEIVVMKLVGATNAFIRRPFLYTGFWYGLLGGIVAWLLVNFSLLTLSGAVEQLASLYAHPFVLKNLPFSTTSQLFLFSVLLGLAGSWLAVGRHLKEIEPS